MSAWITMSPLYRVQQDMPTRKSNHRYCRLELPLVVFPALKCPVPGGGEFQLVLGYH
jgi:hypothetical protein